MTRGTSTFVAVLALSGVLMGGCSGQSPSGAGPVAPGGTPPPQGISASDAAEKIVTASRAKDAVDATWQALAMGGIAVVDDQVLLPAQGLPAGWGISPALAFNLAAEAHDKGIAGRFTLGETAAMWQQLGFPFAGDGTADQQLLAFLRAWIVSALQRPAALESFTPLFLQEMARRQAPPVDLTAPATDPSEVRLTLLELELIAAAFARDLQPAVQQKPVAPVRSPQLASTACGSFKEKLFGVPAKGAEKGFEKVGETIAKEQLEKLGVNAERLLEAFGHMVEVLGMAMKIYKLIEIYASTQVTVTVDGDNPVHKPAYKEDRKLVPVTAHAGIPADDWKQYQQESLRASKQYQEIKDCLSMIGAPMPTDLSEIAESVDKWLVGWELTSGSPKHAYISLDKNKFAFPGSQKMALTRDSESSAKATLQVDITHESAFVELFPEGPEEQAEVTVRASVYTAEPPGAEVVTGTLTVMGTIASILELCTGWVETALPPKSTTKIQVVYREPPKALDVKLQEDQRFTLGSAHVSTSGDEKARVLYDGSHWNGIPGAGYDGYTGSSIFNYRAASLEVPDSDCTWTLTPISGPLQATVGFAFNLDGQLRPDDPMQLSWHTSGLNGPHERLHVECPPPGESPPDGDLANIFTALVLDYDNPFPNPAGGTKQKIPAIPIADWASLPDGSIQKTWSSGRVVLVPGGALFLVDSEGTTITLTPVLEGR